MVSNITINNARMFGKNFSGEAGKFNAAGVRSFCVGLDPDIAEQLEADGWNVRHPRNEEIDDPRPYLQVAVKFGNRPPKILIKSSRNSMLVDEETVSRLDHELYSDVKMVLTPYSWEVNGKSGVKAYLKSMICVLDEDEVEKEISKSMDSCADSSDELPF